MLDVVMQAFTGLFDRRTLVSTFLPAFTGLALAVAVVVLGELGWTEGLSKWDQLGGTGQIVAGVAFVALVAFWSFVAATVRTAVVQCYEGYWPARLWGRARKRWQARLRELRARDAALEARQERLLVELRAWVGLDGAAAAEAGEAALVAALGAPGAEAAGDDDECVARATRLRGWAVAVRDGRGGPYGEAAVERLTGAIARARDALEARADEVARERSALAQKLFLRFPPSEVQVMPTRLGNVLRAAEEHPRALYGLDLAVVWPRLLPLLPAESSEAVQNARTPLDLMMTVSWFALLFGLPLTAYAAFGFSLPWWGIVLSVAAVLAIAYGAYRVATFAALGYGETFKAQVDLHRSKVLEALGIPVPTDRAAERQVWRDVSRALYRGDPLP